MDTINESPTDDRLEVGRAILRESVDQIEEDVGNALRGAALDFPIYVTVPHSGDALAALMTSADPPGDEWETATTIFLRVIADRLGEIGLRSRDRKLRRECRRRS